MRFTNRFYLSFSVISLTKSRKHKKTYRLFGNSSGFEYFCKSFDTKLHKNEPYIL